MQHQLLTIEMIYSTEYVENYLKGWRLSLACVYVGRGPLLDYGTFGRKVKIIYVFFRTLIYLPEKRQAAPLEPKMTGFLPPNVLVASR